MDKKFSPADFFTFEKMVAPVVLKVVYYIGLLGILGYLLVSLAGAFEILDYSASTALGMIVLALFSAVFGALFWRILIEVYMVLFSINDRLGEVRDRMKKDD